MIHKSLVLTWTSIKTSPTTFSFKISKETKLDIQTSSLSFKFTTKTSMYKNKQEEKMEANTHVFNTHMYTTDPLNFPDSFFSTVDEFGDPFVNQVHDAPGASASLVHGGEPSQAPRVKRRKVETRKVINVPVPKESSDAEFVVPTDVWSWRKYGQKPIKGSPYPRGYYKCSGVKNCTAQKQVERSQTDRNMIIVTYISEHNHPYPAQKNSNVSKKKPSSSIESTPKETINTRISSAAATATIVASVAAKTDESLVTTEKHLELENVITSSKNEGHELDQVFENISVDPLMGVMEGWDDIFPCFKGLEDQNGLIMSNEFFDDEWRID